MGSKVKKIVKVRKDLPIIMYYILSYIRGTIHKSFELDTKTSFKYMTPRDFGT